MSLLQAVLLTPALLLALPIGMLALQVAAACRRRSPPPPSGPRPTLAVLVPAHNERVGVAPTLQSIRSQLRPGDRLLVVADNCSDDTAAVARAEGAEVIERRSDTDRGKGHALAFGVDHLRAAPPALLVIIDADCQLREGTLDALASTCTRHAAPAQALDLMVCGDASGPNRRLAEFAWRVKNWVRPRGGAALGLPCALMGTGMAFPWPLIATAGLASSSLVEDMQLGLGLALAGHPAVFCEEGLVVSRFPDSEQAAASQRTRWEHGHLGMIGQQLPTLLAAAWRRRSIRLLAMALDLAIPPLALLVLLVAALWVGTGLVAWAGAGLLAWQLTSGVALVLVVSVLVAWVGWGRAVLRPQDLLAVPGYALSKLGLYARFWSRRQKEWVRTDRE